MTPYSLGSAVPCLTPTGDYDHRMELVCVLVGDTEQPDHMACADCGRVDENWSDYFDDIND